MCVCVMVDKYEVIFLQCYFYGVHLPTRTHNKKKYYIFHSFYNDIILIILLSNYVQVRVTGARHKASVGTACSRLRRGPDVRSRLATGLRVRPFAHVPFVRALRGGRLLLHRGDSLVLARRVFGGQVLWLSARCG